MEAKRKCWKGKEVNVVPTGSQKMKAASVAAFVVTPLLDIEPL